MDATRERAIAMVITAIVETIEETKDNGAPLGPMYAALMPMLTYNSFEAVISSLVRAGVIRVSNHVAYRVSQ